MERGGNYRSRRVPAQEQLHKPLLLLELRFWVLVLWCPVFDVNVPIDCNGEAARRCPKGFLLPFQAVYWVEFGSLCRQEFKDIRRKE